MLRKRSCVLGLQVCGLGLGGCGLGLEGGGLVNITDRKSHTVFRFVPTSVPWMTLNGVIDLILLYFTEFDSFAGLLHHSD